MEKKLKRKRTNKDSLVKKMQNLVRQEYTDFDYLDKLNAKELEWLAKFNNEHLNASFDKNNKNNIVKDKKTKKQIYNENNARNRCQFGRNKMAKKILTYDFIYEETNGHETPEHDEIHGKDGINITEDLMLSMIDLKNVKKLKNTK